jgi:hypothetical protein
MLSGDSCNIVPSRGPTRLVMFERVASGRVRGKEPSMQLESCKENLALIRRRAHQALLAGFRLHEGSDLPAARMAIGSNASSHFTPLPTSGRHVVARHRLLLYADLLEAR